MVMKFQVAKITIYPLSFNKTNFNHLIYKPRDTNKVFKNVKLKRFKTEFWIKFLSLCHKFHVGFTPSRRLNSSKSDFLQMLWGLLEGLLLGISPQICVLHTLIDCPIFLVLMQNGP